MNITKPMLCMSAPKGGGGSSSGRRAEGAIVGISRAPSLHGWARLTRLIAESVALEN
jgi:hypothetical protein